MKDQIKNTSQYLPAGAILEEHGNVVAFKISSADVAAVCERLYFKHSLPLLTITATDERKERGVFRIFYVFGVPRSGIFLVPFIELRSENEFPSITQLIHEASGYERKIKTFFGLDPADHPRPQPIALHENWPEGVFPLRRDFDWRERPPIVDGKVEFQKVAGEGIYEIPVGPVHAGIIEPGHFRFSVAGEEIVKLEPRLGYKHRGVEKLFEVLPLADTVRLAERVSGDTSFTHSLAFCEAMEALGGVRAPERAQYLRVIFSELERLANHFNDLGFIMLDTGYNFGGASGARLRETVMQWSERLSGSRFLRGVNTLGGVTKDIASEECLELLDAVERWRADFSEVMAIAADSSSLLNRLRGTGKIDEKMARDHGAVGVAARAVGIDRDVRRDHPYAAYDRLGFKVVLEATGDVEARFNVRKREVDSSLSLLEEALRVLPAGALSVALPAIKKNAMAVGVAEGWRGEIVYTIFTDAVGVILHVDVRDPSFRNWTLMEHAAPGNVVPDFPLINKSFNLSYSGNDL